MKTRLSVLFILFLAVTIGFNLPDLSEAAQTPASGKIELVESNSQHVVLELTAPPLSQQERVESGATFLELSAQGSGRTDIAGDPQLPIYGTLVAVPQKAKIELKILQDRAATQTLANPVLPAPTLRLTSPSPTEPAVEDGLDYIPNTTIYSANALYPGERVSTTTPAPWRSQRYIRVQFHPYQYNPATRELITHKKIRVEISFGLGANAGREAVGDAVNEGGFEAVLEQALINYESSRAWRTPQRPSPTLPRAEQAASAANSFKISVNADGMYKVTCDSLQTAGFNPGGVNLDTFQLSTQGNEVAIELVEDGDKQCESGEYFLFFGQAPTDYAIPYNVYWLTYGSGNGKRMAAPPPVSGGTTPATYLKTLHLEQNNGYVSFAPFSENADHWIWSLVNYPNNYVDIAANLTDLAPGTTNGVLRALVQSGAQANPYYVMQSTLFSNGTQVNQQDWVSGTALLNTANVNNLVNGANTFRVQDRGYVGPGIYVYLNYLELEYTAQFVAASDVLRFKYGANGTWQYQIQGFTNSNLRAYNISDYANVSKLAITAQSNGGTFTGVVSDNVNSPREYMVLSNSQFKSPLSVVQDTPSSLRTLANGADYLIITYGAWKNNVQPLAAQRATLGRVKVVDVEDIYDEFNFGIKSAQAIRNFLEYAYANWQAPAPYYVLLAGNGNSDNGNNEISFIPVNMKFADNYIGMVAADNRYVNMDAGSLLPSMAIGRLPARSAAEMDNMVNKLLAYENNNNSAGNWQKKVMFVTDSAFSSSGQPDSAGNFFELSEEVAGNPDFFPAPPMIADRVYFNRCDAQTYPQCALPFSSYNDPAVARSAVLAGIQQGRLIVNYVGHGAILSWAQSLLKASDAENLTRNPGDPKYPFMMPMTCYDGYFFGGGFTSLSEALLVQKDGGAVGSFAPASLGVASGHDFLDRGFFQALLKNGKPRVGLATMGSKTFLFANSSGGHYDLLDTYNLLGDPGMMFALPDEIRPTPTPTDINAPTATPTATPCAGKPGAPALISPANDSSQKKTKVTLTWNQSTCATKYKYMLRQDGKKGLKIKSGKQSGTTITIEGLAKGHDYYWYVKACNGSFGCTRGVPTWSKFHIKP